MLRFDLVKKYLNLKSCGCNGVVSKLLMSPWGGRVGHYLKIK
jgi:hypothetical protein